MVILISQFKTLKNSLNKCQQFKSKFLKIQCFLQKSKVTKLWAPTISKKIFNQLHTFFYSRRKEPGHRQNQGKSKPISSSITVSVPHPELKHQLQFPTSVTGSSNRSSVRLRPVPHYHVRSWMVVHPTGITNVLRCPLYPRPRLFLRRQSKGFICLMCPDHSPSLRDVKAGAQGRPGAQRQGLRQRPWRKLLSHLLSWACSDCFLSFSFFLSRFLI